MAKHVCPWWIGYLLISPIRRWFQNPEKILSPYIREGMTVLEIGPGMGFFTLPAARMVGESGKVITVDIQEKMLETLAKRAAKVGLADRIVTRLCDENDLRVSEPIDLCLAINVVHEVPDPGKLFRQISNVLKPAGRLLVSEPGGWHVSEKEFQESMDLARAAGLKVIGRPRIKRSQSALLTLEQSGVSSL